MIEDKKYSPEEEAKILEEAMARGRELYQAEISKPKIDLFKKIEVTEEEREAVYDTIRDISIHNSRLIREATDTSHCYTPEDLGKVIIKYVRYIQNQDKRGIRLYELNRRFGYVAKRLGSTTSEIMNNITDTGEVTQHMVKGLAVYLDIIQFERSIEHIKDTAERLKIREEYMYRAFEATKRD